MIDNSIRSILRLNGYLRTTDTFFYKNAYAFVREFLQTPQLPEVTVGLGILIPSFPFSAPPRVEGVPDSYKTSIHTLINAVVEKHVQYAHLPNWQERLLLDLGYSMRLPRDKRWFFTVQEAVNIFGLIPEEEKAFLFDKYGLHKIATMVAHGYTQNLDFMLTVFDNCGGASYEDCFRLMETGVPVEDLLHATQLPIEMVEEFYGN